jgi:uncharacterized membrane-anchored protein YjiN (DUF445 family)
MAEEERAMTSVPDLMSAKALHKDRELRFMRILATTLLIVAALAYAASFAFSHAHPALKYIAAFCEAAMIGALADLFAVVALFRHPMGIPLPHTAILPKNKARIAAGLSEFIQHNFLSSKAIVDRIAKASPADKLREWLLNKENAETVASFATRLIGYLLTALDDQRVRNFLHGVVTSKLKQADFALMAGQLLDLLTEKKRHHAVLDEVLRLVDDALSKPETRDYIARAVVAESKLIEAITKLGLNFDEAIARKIVSGAAKLIEEVRKDRDHALRRRFDEFIAQFIEKLKHDDDTRRKVEKLRDELVQNPALAGYIGGLWQEFRGWLTSDLAAQKSLVHEAIVGMVSSLGSRIDANPEIRAWIDEQILKHVPALIDKYKGDIGRFIEDRINGWRDDVFVLEMERGIGRDLQFIRINGTIVGGLAGLLIYVVSQHFG